MVIINKLSHKHKIILKLYFKYITKKILNSRNINKKNANCFYSNKIVSNNKFRLESILNNKYFEYKHNVAFNNFNSKHRNLLCNSGHKP